MTATSKTDFSGGFQVARKTMGCVVVTWQRIARCALFAQLWWSRIRRAIALSPKLRFTLQWNIVFIGNIMNIFVRNIIANDFFCGLLSSCCGLLSSWVWLLLWATLFLSMTYKKYAELSNRRTWQCSKRVNIFILCLISNFVWLVVNSSVSS